MNSPPSGPPNSAAPPAPPPGLPALQIALRKLTNRFGGTGIAAAGVLGASPPGRLRSRALRVVLRRDPPRDAQVALRKFAARCNSPGQRRDGAQVCPILQDVSAARIRLVNAVSPGRRRRRCSRRCVYDMNGKNGLSVFLNAFAARPGSCPATSAIHPGAKESGLR
jgi:hypothetical protein